MPEATRFPRFVVRTIRNGTVRIFGHDYKPRLDASRFDGNRAAFALYRGEPGSDGGRFDERGLMNAVALWGSERAYRGEDDWPGPYCEDGYFKWEWWVRDA